MRSEGSSGRMERRRSSRSRIGGRRTEDPTSRASLVTWESGRKEERKKGKRRGRRFSVIIDCAHYYMRERKESKKRRKRRGRREKDMTLTWSRAGGTWESMSLKSKVRRGLTWLPQAMWTQLGPSGATRLRWVRVRESTEKRKHS